MGSSKMVQKVLWKGATCILKSLLPSGNEYHQGLDDYSDQATRTIASGIYREVSRWLNWDLYLLTF